MAINKVYIKNSTSFFSVLEIFFIVFLAGLLNAESYFNLMGLSKFSVLIKFTFYIILFLFFFKMIINKLLIKKLSFRYKYWITLIFAVLLKFFILFIQDPLTLFPEGEQFSKLVTFGSNFLLMIYLLNMINTERHVKISIYGLGLGLATSTIIPLLLYPEMIGYRFTNFQGFAFIGGFWNPSVISFISIGWLLIAMTKFEKGIIRNIILYSIFLIILFGGIAGLSRGLLLSVLVSLMMYLIFAGKFKKYIKVILVTIITVILVINFFPELYSNFSDRVDDGIDIQEEPRFEIWLDYIEDIPSYILFGEIEGNYTRYSNTRQGPHSVILNWLVQFGLLALVGFILLINGLFKSAKRIKENYSKETAAAIYAWIAAYLSVALINETGFEQLTIFAGFGIIIGWGNIYFTKDTLEVKI